MKLIANNDRPLSLQDFTRWTFEPTGDYAADCATGRRLVREFLVLMKDIGFSPALGHVVTSISRLERDRSGLEIGFFQALSSILMNAELPPPSTELGVVQGGRQ